MATPTPGKHPQVVATPPVSTPFSANHPAFSPHGPRSVVPSPQAVKKSPANSNTLYGYPSGGNHPTNSSFGVGYDSPSAAMALAGVPGLAELGLEGMGAQAMGGTLDAMGRQDDDERRKKLGQVVEVLKTSKGRLSEVGIERLARRVGLECLWEPHMGSGGNMRTLIIAGSALALDIDFSNNVVKRVALSFHESPEIVSRHTEKAGAILLQDLQVGTKETPLTKLLDRFAANLERLAAMDRLSVIPGLNCHEAIAGIYESLERLHNWEIARLEEQDDMAGKDAEHLERMAVCTRSGKSVMHGKDRVGLSIEYWMEKRQIFARSKRASDHEKTWTLLVECAPAPAPPLVYTPIRVSENWISADIQKANPAAEELILVDGHGPVLDWLEPENTLLPSTETSKIDGIEGMDGIDHTSSHKYPDVMFVAKFDPPIIVPYGVAMQIHNSTNAHLDMYQTTTFDGLMFPHAPKEKVDPVEARTIRKRTAVPVFSKDGKESTKIHENTLFIDKIDYGRTLNELPFSHPRQLMEMLPSLRQYAFLSTVLKKSFGGSENLPETPRLSQKSKRCEFEEFMEDDLVPPDAPLTIDVSFATQPIPRIQLAFPFKKGTANVIFDIKLNGVVEVVSQNVLEEHDDGMEGGRGITVADLGKMLEITEDLGVWAEYVRRRLND